MSTELREYCAETVWDGPYQMVCSYTIVKGECVRHGKRAKRLPVKPSPELLAAESRGRAAGWREAIAALRDTDRFSAFMDLYMTSVPWLATDRVAAAYLESLAPDEPESLAPKETP